MNTRYATDHSATRRRRADSNLAASRGCTTSPVLQTTFGRPGGGYPSTRSGNPTVEGAGLPPSPASVRLICTHLLDRVLQDIAGSPGKACSAQCNDRSIQPFYDSLHFARSIVTTVRQTLYHLLQNRELGLLDRVVPSHSNRTQSKYAERNATSSCAFLWVISDSARFSWRPICA